MSLASSRPHMHAPAEDVTAPASQGADGPRHVALIMDGNGRWAQSRGLPRTLGHRAGVNALRRTVEAAPELGIACLTVFGFSTENWRRPRSEILDLMGLLKAFVASDLARLERNGVKIRVLGRRDDLSPEIADIIASAEARTAHNDRMLLQVAFNYGARGDVVEAARRFANAVKAGEIDPDRLDEQAFSGFLSTADSPPLDLVVRTSGERRLSNFLLWEAAYAEFVFQDVLWPDYGHEALERAVNEYRGRERRFGGIGAHDALAAG